MQFIKVSLLKAQSRRTRQRHGPIGANNNDPQKQNHGMDQEACLDTLEST